MTQFNNNFYKNLFNKVHNILRDGETALTGMAALNEINNFILFIFIEPKVDTLFQGVDNADKLKFSYLVREYIAKNKTKKVIAFEILAQLQKEFEDIMRAYLKQDKIKKYIKTEVNKSSCFVAIKPRTNDEEEQEKYQGLCRQLFELIKELSDCLFKNMVLNNENIKKVFDSIDFDMLGDAYEQFKEDEVGNQGKRMGQYFTPRSIIKHCIEKQIQPKGTEKVYDSSCGTGGFIHYLNKYVCEEDGENKEVFKGNIYGNDKTADVMKPLYINLLLHDIGIENIKNRNSLGKTNCKECFEKFDVCVGNPPYGLKNKVTFKDFNNIITDEENTPKGFNYWPSLLKTGSTDLIKDSMGQFLVHVINSLKVGGRFSLVIDRGILNNGTEGNSWQKKLRKWFLTCCKLEELILLPKGIFTHTMFDTAIIYGIKEKSLEEMQTTMCEVSTTAVNVFIADFVDKESKRGLHINDEPTDVLDISTIIEKEWSLKYDDYVQTEEVGQDGLEYKTLGEVCEFKKGNMITKKKFIAGEYPVIGGGKKPFGFHNKFNKAEHTILCSQSGAYAGYISKYNTKVWASDCFSIHSNIINEKLIYVFLKTKQENIYMNQTGQAQPHYSMREMREIKIPILSPEHQERIVNFMDDFVGEDYGKLDQLVSEFKDIDLFEFLIREDYDTMGLAIEYITKKNLFQTENKKFNDQRKRCCFKTVPAEIKTLGEVCDILKGSFNTKDIKGEGTIPYYNSGSKCPCNFHTEFTIDYPEYIIYVKDGGDKYNKTNLNCGMAKPYYVQGKSAVINQNLILKAKNTILCKYLYYYLHNIRIEVMKLAKYNSGLGHITKKQYETIRISVPSLEDQQKVVDMIEAIDAEDSQYNQMLDGIKSMIETVYQSVTNITT